MQGDRIHRCGHRGLEQRSEFGLLVSRIEAEHRPQDHRQRDLLHRVVGLEDSPHWPAVDLVIGGVAHHLPKHMHALSMKGRQQELAVAHVLRFVEHQDRVLADHRAQREVAFARMQHFRVTGEHRLDVRRVTQEHERAPSIEAQREDVPEASVGALHQLDRSPEPTRHLQSSRGPRAWGEAHRAMLSER